MPTISDINLFRRLVGDFNDRLILDADITQYLNDAAREVSAQEEAILLTNSFDLIPDMYKPEVIYQAAINWWWNRAAKLSDKHSQTVGQSSQNVGEKFDRAMQMIDALQTKLTELRNSTANHTVYFGHNSRFSRSTLTRIGGKREEDALNG